MERKPQIPNGQSNEANDNAVMYILPQPMSDNRRVLIIFRDGLINLWGIQKSETLFTCGRNMPLVIHNEAKKVVSACWTCSFGSKIAVGYSNGEIHIWGVPKASDKIPSAVRDKELSLKNIPLLKLNLGYKMEKVPILSLRWISADGQASRLYVNGASEHGSSNIFQVIILNENAESRTIKLVLPLSEACVDMQIVSTIAENNKCKKNALLLLLRSGCLCAYDDSEIEHYLLQCHSKFSPPLPRQISVKLPFGDSNATVAQYITDVPNLSSNMAEDHKLSTKKFSSFLPPDLEEPDRNCFSTQFCGFSKTSNLYMTGHYDGAINFWDASCPLLSPIFSIKQKSEEDDHPSRDTPVTSLYFDVSSEILVCGYQNGLVSIFQFKGTQSAADNIFSLLQARRGCNYIVNNVKLNGAIVAINMQPSSGHIAIGTDRGYVSVIEMKGMSVLYERRFPCEHPGIISLQFECSLNKSNKNILLAALNDSSVFAFEFHKGSAESTPVVHPKRTSRALFMQILNELNMSPRGLQKHDFSGESKGNSMKSNVLRQSLLLLCSEKSIRIYSLGHIIQGIKKVCHKKKLHGTCCWASTFHSPDDIGLILIFTCGKIEIRSLPDLMLLRETSVRGFTFPDINSGSGFSGSLCASCDGDIIAVMGDQEMFFLSLFQKGNYRLLASVHEVYKKDMVASLEKLSSKMTHTHKEKKSGIFNTVIREMKGKKTDEATEFLDSDAVIGQELSAIFSTINFSLNVENFKSHSIGEDDVELNIDDINLEDPIEKTKGHEIAVNDKRKLGKKFQSLKGKLKSITRKAETSINEEHGGGKVIGAVDEIKKKYGFPSSGELNAPKLAQSKLSENLAKLQGINMRTAEMQDNARSFSSMANELLRTAEQAKRMP